ncbi:hypothetical protein K439DRAFT_1362562, partial [Ramaria rubella]
GEHDIYKINLLEGMLMARKAWNAVGNATLKNCWSHIKIQGYTQTYNSTAPRADPGAWDIFDGMTLPQAEERLRTHLGSRFNHRDWQPALDAVMKAEIDSAQALEAVDKLAAVSQLPQLAIRLPARHPSSEIAPQIADAENQLMGSINELVKQKRIFGTPPTLEELVALIEGNGVGDSPYQFHEGDAEIVAEVKHEIAVGRGEIIEVDDSDSEEEGDKDKSPPRVTARGNRNVRGC